MPLLARRNLFHDKIRLAVTVTGIVFAVVLIVVELGLFFGFTSTTSSLVDHSGADLWVTSRHVPYLEMGVPFSERKLYQVRSIPGVQEAQKMIILFTQWKRGDGRQESVEVIGIDPDSQLARPWNLVQGQVEDLKRPGAVIVDEIYKQKLGVTQLGELFELRGHRGRVVGFTRGIRSFSTSPYVFTTFKNAQDFTGVNANQTIYILVKTAPGADVSQVRNAILAKLKGVQALTRSEFSHITQFYWMFTTGAGVALLLAALLGLVVGFVVVAQTIYATTMDHLKEFGTLKAMGARNGYVYKVIIQQAAMSALIGYVLGMIVSALVVRASGSGGAAILLSWQMAAAVFLLTLAMCIGAAMVSISKVNSIDPAMVFKS